tara:strand:- start:711 stop:836 length:126 start_codon:yes stop_codon:yes gene_type:complete
MVDGRISDFHTYQKNVGIAQGLDQSCEIIEDTIKKLNIGDE